MKCLISSAPVSQASRVDPISAHLQMVYTDPEILYYMLFYLSKGSDRPQDLLIDYNQING